MASNRGSPTSGSLRYAKRAICCNVSAFWSTKLSKVDIFVLCRNSTYQPERL